ncbi:MAG: SEC-C metal-binding domain-containing protein [Defluviitaleaceae bacterium]|nr:SEC-C metal-binding domain-containing protein [Defluviitaleaceae bacterium]
MDKEKRLQEIEKQLKTLNANIYEYIPSRLKWLDTEHENARKDMYLSEVHNKYYLTFPTEVAYKVKIELMEKEQLWRSSIFALNKEKESLKKAIVEESKTPEERAKEAEAERMRQEQLAEEKRLKEEEWLNQPFCAEPVFFSNAPINERYVNEREHLRQAELRIKELEEIKKRTQINDLVNKGICPHCKGSIGEGWWSEICPACEASSKEHKPQRKIEKVGLNSFCLCGSGKKYKRCCHKK